MCIVYSELEEEKSTGSSSAAWYSASVELGRWEPFLSLFSPAHALTHGASRFWRAFGTRPGGCPRQGPRTMPRRLPGAGHGAGALGGRSSRGSAARCGSRSARPSCRTLSRLPSRRSGWVSGGRVPIMNEQSRAAWREPRACLPPARARGSRSGSESGGRPARERRRGAGRGPGRAGGAWLCPRPRAPPRARACGLRKLRSWARGPGARHRADGWGSGVADCSPGERVCPCMWCSISFDFQGNLI